MMYTKNMILNFKPHKGFREEYKDASLECNNSKPET